MPVTISLVMPCYNVATYVPACLESIASAAERVDADVELVCVDDGSTDATGAILDAFARRPHPFVVRVIHQANLGVSAARNRGLEVSTGDWLLFPDSDDAVVPEYLSVIVRAIRETDADIIRFGHREVGSQAEAWPFVEGTFKRYDLRDSAQAVAVFDLVGTMYAWNCGYRRSAIGDLRFHDQMQPGEDSLFNTQLFCRAGSVAVTETPLYKYLQHGNSCMNSATSHRKVISAVRSTEGRLKALEAWPHYPLVESRVFGMLRTTYIGQLGRFLRHLDAEDRAGAWAAYFDAGTGLFKGEWPYGSIFEKRSRWLWFWCLYLPWEIRVALLRFAFVRCLRDQIRKFRN